MWSTSKEDKQRVARDHSAQVRDKDLALDEQIHQEGRRRRLEPPGAELALLEQQQHVEGVVDRLAGPVVAVVPGADLARSSPASSGANTVSKSASV
jgi:hypothetical protein